MTSSSKWGSVGVHELFVKAKHFAPQQLEFKPGDREHPAELNVTLAAGHRIRGRVVDEQGQAPGRRDRSIMPIAIIREANSAAVRLRTPRDVSSSTPCLRGLRLRCVKEGYSAMENVSCRWTARKKCALRCVPRA